MGKIGKHAPVKLFAGVTCEPSISSQNLLEKLESLFGKIDHQSPEFAFDRFTDYYQDEMGTNLLKRFVSFSELIDPADLPACKLKSNRLENAFSRNNSRTVNIDPGYICDSKLVLATTKNYSHRLYLDSGIFGDLHLMYKNKTFRAQPWTYPDYQRNESIGFFNEVRRIYRQQRIQVQEQIDDTTEL